ncbi:hypothetical protein [Yoonia litorea]|uniref:Uncharacterized protein n=1 Tax=Yoonia litorea TaxID=1123755 RepID=A0A1I6LCG2_9RHOB|nr:hypothetical protein [Yoonia litorea]SFS01107.1 hypothetical protein SAMN05444714_0384 [Yoonia litorea]
MRPAIIILPLAFLAACATPREQCINQVTRDSRVLSALIAETEGNLARGYALETRQEVRTVSDTCRGRNPDGTVFLFSCEETETVNRTVPVAIDLNAEQAKLTSLRERLATERRAADAAVAQCIAANPE